LRQLGAVQIGDGLVALPLDERTREQFEWLAQEAEDAGGQASIWLSQPASSAQHRALAARMEEAVAADYRAVIEAAESASDGDLAKRRRAATRLRRTLERIKARDFFPPPERRVAERAVAELAARIEARR
jgi:hypothetical protein